MKREDITMFFLWMMIELRFSTLKFKFSMSWGSCTLIQVDGDSGAIDFGMLELWLALIMVLQCMNKVNFIKKMFPCNVHFV